VAAVGFALQAAALGLGSALVLCVLDDGISAVLRIPELYAWALVAIVVLGETLKTNDTGWFALVLAIVAMVVATVALAPGAGAVHRPDGRRQDRRIA
jgi:hypothetical protein